ncbi:MAG TPA: hypothetical protein VK002_08245 [Rubricoccaceae bacterium]|nr:hypothetical protein [Rubricoccaceae bacterium]
MHRRLLPLVLLLFAAPAIAQPEIAGDWAGALDVSGLIPNVESLTVVFHIAPADSGYTATFDSPDQGAYGLPVQSVAYDAATRTLTLTGQQTAFTGVVDADGARIEGTWAQGGRELPLVLTPYEAPAEEAASAPKPGPKPARGDLSGAWVGALAIPGGGEVRMTFHLTRNAEGVHEATLDAPGQAENLQLGPIEVRGRDVTIDIMGQASFTGVVAEDEATMEGTFAQGGQKLPMTLTRR